MPKLYQGSFNAGEIASGVYGRIDLEKFAAGLRLARNMIPRPEGGLVKRPGTQFVGYHLDQDNKARLVPFKFNNDQTYMFVIQPDVISIIKNGGVLLNGTPVANPPTSVATVSNQLQITTAVGTAPTSGDFIFWNGAGGYEELDQKWLEISPSPAPTTTTYYVREPHSNVNLDSTGFTSTALAGALVYSLYSLDNTDGWYSDGGAGYASPAWNEIDYTGANDLLYIAHEGGPSKEIARGADDVSWTITDFDPTPGGPAMGTVSEVVGYPILAGKDQYYGVTALDTGNETYEESLLETLLIEDIDVDALSPASYCEIDWTHVTGADKYRVYKATNGVWGLIGTVEGTSGTLVFRDTGLIPNLSIAPPLSVDVFDASDKYPRAVELFQQRIWFGGTNNLLRDIYASRSGSLSSFATSTVNTDDDPIQQAIVATSVQEVRYIVPLKNLVILTSDGEWGFDTGDLGVLSPSSGLIGQSYWGSARVKPALVGNSAIFVEQSGQSLRDLAYALSEDGFASSEITLLANHLFRDREVVDMCFSKYPFSLLFVVFDDGRAASCTYVRDQEVFAWARHDTGGFIESCGAVREGGVDNIYLTVKRESTTGQTYRQIERMEMIDPTFQDNTIHLDNSTTWQSEDTYILTAPRIEGGELEVIIGGSPTLPLECKMVGLLDPLYKLDGLAFLLDDTGVSQTGTGAGEYRVRLYRHVDGSDAVLFRWEDYSPDTQFSTLTAGVAVAAASTFEQAHHLSNRDNVVARADLTMESVTVSEAGEFSPTRAASILQVGETFKTDIETLDIDDASSPVTGLPMNLGRMIARFDSAMAYSVGRIRSDLRTVTMAQLMVEEDWDPQKQVFDGVSEDIVFPTWKKQGRMSIQSEDCWPLSLLAVIPSPEIGDINAE